MSTVYIIKDGVIVDKTIAHASYRSSKGVTVKPRTAEEELELIRLSENNKRIKVLREEVAALKQAQVPADCARRLEEFFAENARGAPQKWEELESTWNEARSALSGEARELEAARILRQARELRRELLQAELENRSRVSDALEKVAVLRRDADKLTSLLFSVRTSEGPETMDAQVDGRTAGLLKQIQQRIEAIGAGLLKEDAEVPEDLQTELDTLASALQELPEKARSVFTAELWRQEQAQNVCDRLAGSGWQIRQKFTDGGFFDDVSFTVESAAGDRALISFTIGGEVRIDSQFSGPGGVSRRDTLQKAVLQALIDGGARSPKSICMDEAPEPEPEPNISKEDSPINPAEPTVQIQQESGENHLRREGVQE